MGGRSRFRLDEDAAYQDAGDQGCFDDGLEVMEQHKEHESGEAVTR